MTKPNNAAAAAAVLPLTIIATQDLRPCDVLLGRGSIIDRYPGNVAFRHCVATHKAQYRTTYLYPKTTVAQRIVDAVADNHGRFLRRVVNEDTDQEVGWTEVDNNTALDKTKQALREKRRKKKGAAVSSTAALAEEGVANLASAITNQHDHERASRLGMAMSNIIPFPSSTATHTFTFDPRSTMPPPLTNGGNIFSLRSAAVLNPTVLHHCISYPIGSATRQDAILNGMANPEPVFNHSSYYATNHILNSTNQNRALADAVALGSGLPLANASISTTMPLLNSFNSFGHPLLLRLAQQRLVHQSVLERQAHQETVQLQELLSNWLVQQQQQQQTAEAAAATTVQLLNDPTATMRATFNRHKN